MIKYEISNLPLLNNSLGLSNHEVLTMLEKMLLIRYTEERIAQRIKERKITTPCHLYIGEEACAVGVCYELKESDYVFSNHRSHGHFLAKGGKLEELFSEIYCKSTGCSGGRGGSMHLCDPSKGLLGSSSIVAGSLGIGIGPALKSKILNKNNVSVIFHGDCVPEEGIWSESLNFSAVNKLPVIYINENNLYAASASLEERRIYDNFAEIALKYGLNAQIVDGNDIFAVSKATREAVLRARNGEGPQFIECRTYRWLGHVGPNDDIDAGLRDYNELMFWKSRCPIKNLIMKLTKENKCTNSDIDRILTKVNRQVDYAENFALNSSYPNPNTILDNIYHKGESYE